MSTRLSRQARRAARKAQDPPDTRLRVSSVVLAEVEGGIVVRAETMLAGSATRGVTVLAHPRLEPATIAAELRALADELER